VRKSLAAGFLEIVKLIDMQKLDNQRFILEAV
jgi:hypothetical protein